MLCIVFEKSEATCSWRQTSGCTASGQREPANDKPCDVTIATAGQAFAIAMGTVCTMSVPKKVTIVRRRPNYFTVSQKMRHKTCFEHFT